MITVTNLRKIFTEQGTKGASKWKREDFDSSIIAAEFAAYAEDAERAPKPVTSPKRNADGTLKGKCTDCGIRRITKDVIGPTLCAGCLEYAEWENSHGDHNHDAIKNGGADAEEFGSADALAEVLEMMEDCPVCHPELDPRNVAPRGRSRAGMVIVAKGTEIHKSATFKAAAENAGWTVKIMDTFEGTSDDEARYVATATRGSDSISLAWNGRAYDYSASSARLRGKDRKVRNLKEALRLL